MSPRPSAARLTRRGTVTHCTVTRGLVVLVVWALAGCAPSRGRATGSSGPAASPLAVRVDNRSEDRVDIYLIQGSREWHLGRVEPGATAALPLPALPAVGGQGMARLAVIPGAARTLDASREARVTSPEQPVAELLRQRWTFTQGQLRGL